MPLRTPIKRARGLGSAKDGVGHWWLQRVTAVALIPLVMWLSFGLASNVGGDYAAVREWVGSPFTAGLFILLIGTMYFHAQLGLQVVIEDYIHGKLAQLASLIAVKFLAAVLALTGILAVLRIAFGG
ncbi:succinate dehydrogenase / fumarate reductase membrane anchor subunit [Natronocella acetinitrilica]|jgi:succinate dehydrogenase / fumarate reductase, membrane anchor subunit|uniref:Succinate dehydrogenase hydrophobic membrane anchor subunit n=1 Tax=Natronocella acetinitrilica TaxID=414046 RepID=A0AAE3G6F8_9GAMM|nr:succinate dehydrogenase, hydrophobic membrane anchor protein [Natronocella acetinitrilica]MCP1675914.1 succinate dehydrogenase / fumarate reductase membrane anchor subunit [Natronocella acetinitrilica]